MKVFYVTVKRADKTGWLHGPHADHEAAKALVRQVREVAESVDMRCVWDAFGTSSIDSEMPFIELFPTGVLNGRDGLPA